MTQKKIENISHKFIRDHPEILAELCAAKYPVQWKFIPGQTVFLETPPVFVPGDTVECPDGSTMVTPSKEAQCPPHEIRVDTIQVPDLALADHWRYKASEWQVKASVLESKLEAANKRTKQLRIIAIVLGSLLVAFWSPFPRRG